MADNDVSKNYALNIEVGVDASSLESLKNVKKSIEEISSQIAIPSSTADINERNVNQFFEYQKSILSGKRPIKEKPEQKQQVKIVEKHQDTPSKPDATLEKILEELKQIKDNSSRASQNHAQNTSTAQYTALGDISKQVTVQIIQAFNRAVESISGDNISYMSSRSGDDTPRKTTPIADGGKQSKKVRATTGKSISANVGDLPDGVSALYNHDTHEITVGSHLSGPQRQLAVNHEYNHPVQEKLASTYNNYLAMAKANVSRFMKEGAESVNEFMTNTIALIQTAIQNNGDAGAIKEVVNKYNETVFGRSGVMIKNLRSFTKMIERISSLNVSPETLLSNVGTDIASLSGGHGTVLSRAAMSANYSVKSDGTVRDKNGSIVSDKRLMQLRDDSGRRINAQDIASHNMAHYIAGSSGSLKGVDEVGGRKRFLSGASRELLNIGNVGVQYYSQERLEKDNGERMSSPTWYDVQKRIFNATKTTHFGDRSTRTGSTMSTRERHPERVKYGLKTNLERLAYAIGDDNTLSTIPKNAKNVSQEELMEYLTGYLFNGSGKTETGILSQNNAMSENYGNAKEILKTAVNRWFESGNQNSDVTFRGSNMQNQELADIVSIAKTMKSGIARGRLRSDIKRIYEKSLSSAIGGKVGDAKTLEDVIASSDNGEDSSLTARQQAIRTLSERVSKILKDNGRDVNGKELSAFIDEINRATNVGAANSVGGITITRKELESLKRLVGIASGQKSITNVADEYEFGQEAIGRTLPVVGSIFESKSGAYNLAVGNLDSLSMATKAPIDILRGIVKNRSNLNHFNKNGEINPRYGMLQAALTEEGFNRMSQLERPVYDILSTQQSIAGGFSEREKASTAVKEVLKKYLHRGSEGAIKQLTTVESFSKDFMSELSKAGISDKLSKENEKKISELYRLVENFNQRSLVSSYQQRADNLSYMEDASQSPIKSAKFAYEEASESAARSSEKRSENRMIGLRGDYDKKIMHGEHLLLGRNVKEDFSDYNRDQYKHVSDVSVGEGDYATGNSVSNKDALFGAEMYLRKKHPDTGFETYKIRYKEGLSNKRFDLGNLNGYSSEEIDDMIKAVQSRELNKKDGSDLVTVAYTIGKKKKEETTARSNDMIESVEMLSPEMVYRGKKANEDYHVYENMMARGVTGAGTSAGFGVGIQQDVVSGLANSIKTIIGRITASSEIKNISSDVRAIRKAIEGGTVHVNKTTNGDTDTYEENGDISYMASSPNSGKKKSANDTANDVAKKRDELIKRAEKEGWYEGKLMEVEGSQKVKSERERLEEEEFRSELAKRQTKKEKLSLIDERLAKMNEELKEAPEEEKNKRLIDITRLQRRRTEIENGPGTKQDRIEFNKWKEEKRSNNKQIIANLQGKDIREISAVIEEEIKKLLNSGINNTVGNYDKKAEVQRLVVELEKFRQSQAIKQDKATQNNAILELQRRYTSQDNAFNATLKGTSIDERPQKLKEEIDRLNASLDELKKKKDEALSAGNVKLAGFYDTLSFHRETRKSVLEGKLNRAVEVKQRSDQNAQEKAISDAQKTERERQKENSKLIRQHNAEGQQARSIFSKGIEYTAMAAMVYSFTKEVKEAISVMARFERQMVEVTRVMDPLYQSQGMLANSAKDLAKKYGVSIIEAAKGMTVFAQQGKNTAQIIQLTEASLLAANTTTMTAAQATEALTAAIRQFNLTDADAKSVIDSWLEVESRTAIQANTMADAMKISGTAARIAGLSFHEFNGIVSAVGSATRETGSQLGTAFKFIISKMRTEEAVGALQKLGVATHSADGDFRDLMLILSDLNEKWKGMTNEQRAATAITIAGTRRYNTLMTLMERWDEALEATTMSEDSHGKAMRMNATIMDTYEKRVQKARASVESFYASMSRDTTRSLLGGIQKSIESLAELSEKLKLIGPMVETGLVVGGLGLATRLGGSMGVGTALKDVVYKDTATKAVSEALENIRFNGEPFNEREIGWKEKTSLWAKRLFSTEASGGRKEYLNRLNSYERVFQTNPVTNKEEYHNQQRDELAGKIMKRSFSQLTEGTKVYQATLQKVHEQLDKQIVAQKKYISSLEDADPFMRGLKSFGNALEKNSLKLAAFGMAMTSISNMEIFQNKKSATGKNLAGDVFGAAGAAGGGAAMAGMALKLGGSLGPWAAVAAAIPGILQFFAHIASIVEQLTGSDRLGALNRQEESDRLKSLQGAVTKYKGFREKEKRGELLSPEEREQKESAAKIISMADPRSTKRGRRGLGLHMDEDRIDELAGLKDSMDNDRRLLNEEMAYRIMFSSGGGIGGQGNMTRQREKYRAALAESEKAAARLEEFDRKRRGKLTESQLNRRSDLQAEYNKRKEEESKYGEELEATQSAFLSLVEEESLKYADKRRRGDNSIIPQISGSEKRREMFLEFLKNYDTPADAMEKYARTVFAGQFQRSGGTPQNERGAIKHFQETGELLTLTRGKDKNGKAVIILKREDAYGNKQEQSFEFNKLGMGKEYVKEVARRLGVAEEAIAHTSELSDTLHRYNLKEIDKFAEVSRKIGDVVYNSFKEELTKINSLRTMVGKFSISGIKEQYLGYEKQLKNLEKISDTFVKAFGTFNKDITDAILKNASSTDHENAAARATDISSKIAKDGSVLGIGATALNSFVMASQKSLMASEVIQSVLKARIKRDKDVEGSADVLNTDIKRINEYLSGAGLSDTYESIVGRMAGSTEQAIRAAIVEKVSAASELYSKKDIESFVKSIQSLESSIDNLAEHIKDSSKTIELLRQRDIAISNIGGIFTQREIESSYQNMDTSSIDALAGITRGMLSQAKAAKDTTQESIKAATKARDEVYRNMGNRTDPDSVIARKNADEALQRQIRMSEKAAERFEIVAQKAEAVEAMVKDVQATATRAYGNFKAFMRGVEHRSILENEEYYFGTNADNYSQINSLEIQKERLDVTRVGYENIRAYLKNKEATVGLTDDEKKELSGIEKILGEINAKLADVGQKQLDINSSILRVHAEAVRRNKLQQIEHLANKLSRSKDTGRTQKSLFDVNYQSTRDVFREIVGSDLFRHLDKNSALYQTILSLGQKMENMRDTADIYGNPTFNKHYLLASAQDRAIVDQIMARKESGETLKQIFADAGLKEMGRRNPLIGQLLDSLMQKEENSRLVDINNKMYDVQEKLLNILTQIASRDKNPRLADSANNAGTQLSQSRINSAILGLDKPGFAEGTTYTGAGGKYESSGLVEVHKGEGLGVLSQTAMARYPIMSRKVLKMISDMNEGSIPGFASGTRVAGEVFNFGSSDNIFGLSRDAKVTVQKLSRNMEILADIFRINTNNVFKSTNKNQDAGTVAEGFNQGGFVWTAKNAKSGTLTHEFGHGNNGSQMGNTLSREMQSQILDLAITKGRSGYQNELITQQLDTTRMGRSPAKNAADLFSLMGKESFNPFTGRKQTIAETWEQSTGDALRRVGVGSSQNIGTERGNTSFKQGIAQVAGAIEEYARRTGTSSESEINRMYKNLSDMFARVTGDSRVGINGKDIQPTTAETFARATNEFRKTIDKYATRGKSEQEALAQISENIKRTSATGDKTSGGNQSSVRGWLREFISSVKSKNTYSNMFRSPTFTSFFSDAYLHPIRTFTRKAYTENIGNTIFNKEGRYRLTHTNNGGEYRRTIYSNGGKSRQVIRPDGSAVVAYRGPDGSYEKNAYNPDGVHSDNVQIRPDGSIISYKRIPDSTPLRRRRAQWYEKRSMPDGTSYRSLSRLGLDLASSETRPDGTRIRIVYNPKTKEIIESKRFPDGSYLKRTADARKNGDIKKTVIISPDGVKTTELSGGRTTTEIVGQKKQAKDAASSKTKQAPKTEEPVQKPTKQAEGVASGDNKSTDKKIPAPVEPPKKQTPADTAKKPTQGPTKQAKEAAREQTGQIQIAPAANAMKLEMAKTAILSGAEAFRRYNDNDKLGAAESGLKSFGALHNAGLSPAQILEKIGENKAGTTTGAAASKTAKALKVAGSTAFAAAGGMELLTGVAKGDKEKIASGTQSIANAALYSKPGQKLIEKGIVKLLGDAGAQNFIKGAGGATGWGMAAQLVGTGTNFIADRYMEEGTAKNRVTAAGDALANIGGVVSDIGLTASTLGANKVIEGLIRGGRYLFDDDFTNKRVAERAHSGVGGLMTEELANITGVSAMGRGMGAIYDLFTGGTSGRENMDVSKVMQGTEEAAQAIFDEADNIEDSLTRRNYMMKQVKYDPRMQLGGNASNEDKEAQVRRVFGEIANKGVNVQVGGPVADVKQAAMEAFFRGEDAQQMAARYNFDKSAADATKLQRELQEVNEELKKAVDETSHWWNFDISGDAQKRIIELQNRQGKLQRQIYNASKGGMTQEKQEANTKEAAQKYFNELFGRYVDLYGENGILKKVREQARQDKTKSANIEKEQKTKKLEEVKESLFNQNRIMFTYSSYKDMENRAAVGDEKAKAEMEKFDKLVSSNDSLGKEIRGLNKEISQLTSKISDLKGMNVSGDGAITEEDFAGLKRHAQESTEGKAAAKRQEVKDIKKQLKEEEENLKLMQGISSEDAIKKQEAKVKALRERLDTAGMAQRDLEYAGKVERLFDIPKENGGLEDPRKLQEEMGKFIRLRDAARAAADDPNFIRRLKAGKATLKVDGEEKEVSEEEFNKLLDRDNKSLSSHRKAVRDATVAADAATKKVSLDDKLKKELDELRKIDYSKLTEEQRKRRDALENGVSLSGGVLTFSDDFLKQETAQSGQGAGGEGSKEAAQEGPQNVAKTKVEAQRTALKHALDAKKKNNARISALFKIANTMTEEDAKSRLEELRGKDKDKLTTEEKEELDILEGMGQYGSYKDFTEALRKKRSDSIKLTGEIDSEISKRREALASSKDSMRLWAEERMKGNSEDEDVLAMNEAKKRLERKAALEAKRKKGQLDLLGENDKGSLTDEEWAEYQELAKADLWTDYQTKRNAVNNRNVEVGKDLFGVDKKGNAKVDLSKNGLKRWRKNGAGVSATRRANNQGVSLGDDGIIRTYNPATGGYDFSRERKPETLPTQEQREEAHNAAAQRNNQQQQGQQGQQGGQQQGQQNGQQSNGKQGEQGKNAAEDNDIKNILSKTHSMEENIKTIKDNLEVIKNTFIVLPEVFLQNREPSITCKN